jgi:hypothetical protein
MAAKKKKAARKKKASRSMGSVTGERSARKSTAERAAGVKAAKAAGPLFTPRASGRVRSRREVAHSLFDEAYSSKSTARPSQKKWAKGEAKHWMEQDRQMKAAKRKRRKKK